MQRKSSLATIVFVFAFVVAACTSGTDQTPTTSTAATPPDTATTVAPNPGLLTMVFGDQILEYRLDECPAPILAGGGSWTLGDAENPVPADNNDGTEWGIALDIDTVANSFSSVAVAPGEQALYVGDSNETPLESRTENDQVMFAIAFVDTMTDGSEELDSLTTITCDGFSG